MRTCHAGCAAYPYFLTCLGLVRQRSSNIGASYSSKRILLLQHQSYDFLQSILSSSISFHTIILNFIIDLSKEIYDTILTIVNKFIKRKILIFRLFTWDTEDWATVLLNKLVINDWDILRVMISDRNIKFLFKLWKAIFKNVEYENFNKFKTFNIYFLSNSLFHNWFLSESWELWLSKSVLSDSDEMRLL